jgi:hypothetical protein
MPNSEGSPIAWTNASTLRSQCSRMADGAVPPGASNPVSARNSTNAATEIGISPQTSGGAATFRGHQSSRNVSTSPTDQRSRRPSA